MTAPILNYSNFQKPIIVQNNVSLFDVGAVLFQLDDENVEHPVVFCFQTLNPHKKLHSDKKRMASSYLRL